MSQKRPNINDYREEPELKKKRFSLNPFENLYKKDGRGVEKSELKVLDKPSLVNYFKLLRRSLNHVFSCNLFMIFGNFPLLFAIFGYAYTTESVAGPSSQLYPLLQGSAHFDNSPLVMSLVGIFGKQDSVLTFTTLTYVMFAIAALALITFGPVNCGVTYIMRNIVRAEHIDAWGDFWYAVKRNIKQAIIFGVVDIAMIAMLVYDIAAYRINLGGSVVYTVMYVLSYGMTILYFFIRMYVYPMIVTFDMGIFKIIKNSVFFAILGIKRNIMALLATVVFVMIDVYLLYIFLPVGIILPFIILFGLLAYTSVYASFPKVYEVMIEPYYKEVAAKETEKVKTEGDGNEKEE